MGVPYFQQDAVAENGWTVEVIAHRGASAYAPENTLAAFGLAHEMGADWFELDCTLTRDGAIIVIHDDTVDRTTDGTGTVAELSLAYLKQLDAGTWKDPKFAGEPLPTLDESLTFAKDRIGVFIEIKDSADDTEIKRQILARAKTADLGSPAWRAEMAHLIAASGSRNYELTLKTIETVRALGMEDRVVIQSFSPIVCAVALAEAPEIRTEFLGEDTRESPENWDQVIEWVTVLDPPGFNPNKRAMMLHRAKIGSIRDQGKSIRVWTIDGRRDMIQFGEWGVSGLITNRPDFCLSVLQENGLR
ncbi:MAG: hypothetical protein IID08_08215 [Candidatus Hydrogenedentes bacterium]|nr:hypothetical protein [Candidatus Hydrogenedentota bacterium]